MEDITHHIALNIDNVQSLINYCTLNKHGCSKHLWLQLFDKWELPIMNYYVTNWLKEFMRVYTIKNIMVNDLLNIKSGTNHYGYTAPSADYTKLLRNTDFYYLYNLAVTCTDDTFDRYGLETLTEYIDEDTDLIITYFEIIKYTNKYTIKLIVIRDYINYLVMLIFTEEQIKCVLFNLLYDGALKY